MLADGGEGECYLLKGKVALARERRQGLGGRIHILCTHLLLIEQHANLGLTAEGGVAKVGQRDFHCLRRANMARAASIELGDREVIPMGKRPVKHLNLSILNIAARDGETAVNKFPIGKLGCRGYRQAHPPLAHTCRLRSIQMELYLGIPTAGHGY